MTEKINIWNNNFDTIEEIVDDMKHEEEYEDWDDSQMFWEEAYGINNEYLNDEKVLLDIELDQPIIAAADLGSWNGHSIRIGTSFGSNVRDIFKAMRNPDYIECSFFIEDRNVFFEGSHHDGRNRVMFRKLKKGVNIDDITDDVTHKDQFWSNYFDKTESIAPEICEVYGI